MALKLENINNLISDDLTSRNENWTEIDTTFGLKADKTYVDNQNATLTAQLAEIETDKAEKTDVGLLSGLLTTTKTSLVNAINELFNSKANKAQEAWIPLTLLNGASVGSSYTVACYKDTLGVVKFRGRVVVTTPSVIQVSIPVGYRNNTTQYFTIPRTDSPTIVNRVDVSSSGIIIYATGIFDLSCISYRAEA